MKEDFPYEDIVTISRHISENHPEIPLSERAVRFSPFAAISGYTDMIEEVARVTENRIELDENAKESLNKKLNIILNFIDKKPFIFITYFEPDEKKSGGKYVTEECRVKAIDQHRGIIITGDDEKSSKKILIDSVCNIFGDFFSYFEID